MPITDDTKSLRATFNEIAETYDQYRQKYPLEIFRDLVSTTKLSSESRVLEIGPGTGQATLPLCQLSNPHITCVELGENLAGIARKNMATFSKVKILIDNFEQWPLPRDRSAGSRQCG